MQTKPQLFQYKYHNEDELFLEVPKFAMNIKGLFPKVSESFEAFF